MDLIPKEFCGKCYSRQPFYIREEQRTASVRGVGFSYPELYAVCKNCGDRIYSAVLNDKNIYERQKAYYNRIDQIKEAQNGQGV